jgi:RimJ/RimL family protein N-acetyltransferase
VNDPEIARLIDRAGPVTRAEHGRWYAALTTSDTARVFAIEDRALGFVGLAWLYAIHWRHRRAEVRIVIGERRAWGGGRGTDALRVLARVAFGPLGLEKLWADVLTTNPRAVAAFERAGFAHEGLLRGDRVLDGRRVDVVRLGLLRRARPAGPRRSGLGRRVVPEGAAPSARLVTGRPAVAGRVAPSPRSRGRSR